MSRNQQNLHFEYGFHKARNQHELLAMDESDFPVGFMAWGDNKPDVIRTRRKGVGTALINEAHNRVGTPSAFPGEVAPAPKTTRK